MHFFPILMDFDIPPPLSLLLVRVISRLNQVWIDQKNKGADERAAAQKKRKNFAANSCCQTFHHVLLFVIDLFQIF